MPRLRKFGFVISVVLLGLSNVGTSRSAQKPQSERSSASTKARKPASSAAKTATSRMMIRPAKRTPVLWQHPTQMANCAELEKVPRAVCTDAIERRLELLRVYTETHRMSREQFKELAHRAMADMQQLPHALRKFNQPLEVICRLRGDGTVQCVSLVSLIAFYRSTMARALVNDVALLYASHKHLDVRQNTLVSCGEGVWGTMQLTATTTAGRGSRVSRDDQDLIKTLCKGLSKIEKAAETLRARGFAEGSIGISGITGIDPFGERCGFEVGTGTGTEEFIKETQAYIKEMSKRCESTLQGSMSEEQGTQGLPNGSADKQIATAKEITQNGDGTEHVVEVDGDGNQVEYDQQSTQAGDSVEVKYSDGSSGKSESTSTSDGGRIYKDTSKDANGNTTVELTKVNKDGSQHKEKIKPDGTTESEDVPALEALEPSVPRLEPVPKGCGLDEGCSDCRDFNKFAPRMEKACKGADLQSCRAFGQTAACCSNPAAFPVDPRIVLPNDVGDFYCVGGSNIDTEKTRCNARCNIAYSEDCYSNCLAEKPQHLQWDMMDGICRYAIEDWCFGSGAPGAGPTDGTRPSPLPVPYSTQRYAILPVSQLDAVMPLPRGLK